MFDELVEICRRPEPFSVYTADILWTDPHISQQMLAFHLSQDTELASRRFSDIDRFVALLDHKLSLDGKALCDLGCGPGLYAERFAKLGARVCGIDFSENSIRYARQTAHDEGLTIDYRTGDYLKTELPGEQDLVVLIYMDLCALSPAQRAVLYRKVRGALRPEGRFVFDVGSLRAFTLRQEASIWGRRLMNGFWAAGDYIGFRNCFIYESDRIVLDQYTIVEPDRSWQVFNWMQYFSRITILAELEDNGFRVVAFFDNPTEFTDQAPGTQFAVIAQPQE